jgi:acyl-coenzyme A synthetase/AMP-(fatty) acid ligase
MPLPHCIAADCARWRPSLFPAVPTLIRALLRSGLPGDALAPLRGVISAGSPLDPADAAAFVSRFSIRVHSFYGSSETGGISYDRSGEAAVTGRSVGAPLDGVGLRFARGGRFHVSSPAVQGRGSFSPADRGELTPQGELRLVGRVGRLFKIGGRRLDLAGLEAEISSVLSARGVVVAAHPERPESLAALVACDHAVQEARALLTARLAAWKVPARVRVVQELPTTQRGKTDRRKAVELLAGAAGS